MITFIALSSLVLLFMVVDILIQKKKLNGWGKVLMLVLPLACIPALVAIQFDIENNFYYILNEIGIFLSFITWGVGTVGYLLTVGSNQFKFHLFKGLAIALTSALILVEAGYWYYLPLFGVATWIINDLMWNAAFKQKWYYKGDGKGDVFDMTFDSPWTMLATKAVVLAIGIIMVIFLRP